MPAMAVLKLAAAVALLAFGEECEEEVGLLQTAPKALGVPFMRVDLAHAKSAWEQVVSQLNDPVDEAVYYLEGLEGLLEERLKTYKAYKIPSLGHFKDYVHLSVEELHPYLLAMVENIQRSSDFLEQAVVMLHRDLALRVQACSATAVDGLTTALKAMTLLDEQIALGEEFDDELMKVQLATARQSVSEMKAKFQQQLMAFSGWESALQLLIGHGEEASKQMKSYARKAEQAMSLLEKLLTNLSNNFVKQGAPFAGKR